MIASYVMAATDIIMVILFNEGGWLFLQQTQQLLIQSRCMAY